MTTHPSAGSDNWHLVTNVNEIASPAVLVYPDRIAANLRRMIDVAGGAHRLRPHVKTHKLPQVIQMKLDAGITKFKTSTVAETEMTAEAGGKDILLAMQPVGPNVDRLIELIRRYEDAHIAAIVDEESVVQEIARAADEAGQTVSLYVDLNVGMNRTGCCPITRAPGLYQVIDRSAGVVAAGLHAYDGHLHEPDLAKRSQQTETAFAPMWRLIDQLKLSGFDPPDVVVSGTPTSAIMAQQHSSVSVSAGTTVLWDAGQISVCPDLDYLHAAVLITRVISRPAPNVICVDLGHKAVASEMMPPRVTLLGLEDARPIAHSEEHLVLEHSRADEFPVGTVLYGLPTHICPTMALHQFVHCIRDGRAIERWHVTARDRCRSI